MRNLIEEALILNVKPQGENNRLVTWLSPQKGIEKSVLYGGPKSKLRSCVSPFNYGTLYIYNDESKHSSKITDFDVKKYHSSFRESLFKSWAATFCAEIILKTNAAGSFEECLKITNGFLDGLDITEDEQGKKGLVRYLWRYLELLGILPDTKSCIHCDEDFFTLNLTSNTVSYKQGGALYSQTENGFSCSNCAAVYGQNIPGITTDFLSSKSLFYLYATTFCEPVVSRNLILEKDEFEQLKGFVFTLIEHACGSHLNTLESGAGIL